LTDGGSGRGCLTIAIATVISLAVVWAAWTFWPTIWEDLGSSFSWPVAIALVALDVAVSSLVAVRITAYLFPTPPTAPPGPAPAAPDSQLPAPTINASSGKPSGATPGDVAKVAGGTALVVLLIVIVGACGLVVLMSNAMTGHLR
jgi:hypothetical protein